jgi:hypothetical protein
MRFVLACLATMLLSSCALYPVVPYRDRAELVAAGEAEDLKPLDVPTARNMIVGLRLILTESSFKRQRLSLIAGESLFYGTLLAAVGVATDSIATRNVGGGVAALSTVMSNHYRPSDQEAVFHKAAVRAQCVEDALAPISPTVRLFLPARLTILNTKRVGALPEDVTGTYDDVPRVTLDAVNKIQGDLEVALAGIALPASSKDDLNKIFDKWFEKKEEAEDTEPEGDADDAEVMKIVHSSPGLNKSGSAIATKADLRNTVVKECPTERSGFAKEERQRCEILEFAARPKVQIEDAQRQFLTAIQTYKTTVDACLAQHTQ